MPQDEWPDFLFFLLLVWFLIFFISQYALELHILSFILYHVLYYKAILLSVIKIIFENKSGLYKKHHSAFVRISILKCDLLIIFFSTVLSTF